MGRGRVFPTQKRAELISILFSACYWPVAAATAILLFPGALLIWSVTAPFDPTRSLLHRYTCWWAQLYLRCLPGCRLEVEGREKIAPHTSYVLVANHQSAADILALSALAVPFKWISKRSNFRIPFIGWNMYLNGYIKVEPGKVQSVHQTMERCRSWLERGIPPLWFPEGQRSFTGELLPFHGGAFRLAAESGSAVVPIVVEGTRAVYRGWRVQAFPGRIQIRVLDPVTLAEAGGTAEGLREYVWHRTRQELMALRGQQSAEAHDVV
jgi:1-acyl-sn-glycerol-3-phosphate acyltransferase